MTNQHEILDRAIDFAVRKHLGQYRTYNETAKVPYVSHPFDVMKKLTRYGVEDPELLSAAMLHDVVEDTDTSLEKIEFLFGKRVATIVDYVTWPGQFNKQQKWRHLAAKVGDDSNVAVEGNLLKIADRVSNVEDYRSVSKTRRYASKYALEGFPVFFQFITQVQPTNELNFDRRSIMYDLRKMEKYIKQKYEKFDLELTSLEEAEAMRFGPKDVKI